MYNSLPFAFVPYLHYSIPAPAPLPFQRQCAYAVNPRTVYNSPLGNPKKLEVELKEKGLFSFYTKEEVVSYRDIPWGLWIAYFLFEFVPKKLLMEEPEDPYSLVKNHACLPVASDIPILLSVWNLDFPDYGFLLGKRKNLLYSESCENTEAHRFVPYLGNGILQVYAYSERGFYFPGQSFRTPAVLSVDLFDKKTLVFLMKEGKLYKVFDLRTIRKRLEESGSYRLYAYTYKYRLWKFYFGLRFLFCTPDFQAM